MNYGPDIVFLSEAIINKVEAENLKWKLGNSNTFGVSSRSSAGGLCIFFGMRILTSH